jgi:hypothetical protein
LTEVILAAKLYVLDATDHQRSITMASTDNRRMERLAAWGAKREIPTPDGEVKLSAVIVQLAEPLLKQHGTSAQRAEAIISLVVAGWNKSMFPPDKQPIIERDLIACFVPKDGSAEDIGVAIDVMDMVAERRNKLFPEVHKIIVDYELDISGGRLTLNVTSAPIPDLA